MIVMFHGPPEPLATVTFGRVGHVKKQGMTMDKKNLLAGLCISLLPLSAAAVPVTYEFSGQVTMAMADGEIDPLTWVPFVPFGTAFTGSFTYETETPVAFTA